MADSHTKLVNLDPFPSFFGGLYGCCDLYGGKPVAIYPDIYGASGVGGMVSVRMAEKVV